MVIKKKILVIQPTIAPYRVDFFNALYDAFDCEVILWYNNSLSQIYNRHEVERQLHFIPQYMMDLYGRMKLPRGLFKEFRRFKPDVILCNEFNPITIEAIVYKKLYAPKCKVVTLMDDSYNMVVGGENHSYKHKLSKRVVLPLVDQIICVEPRVEEYLQKKYGKGITFPIITEDKRYREKLFNALPISEKYVKKYSLEEKHVLLFVGRLVHLKNVQEVIPLFKKMNRNDYVFVIVGEGQMEPQLKKLAGDSKNIIFTGKQNGPNLFAWYNVAQLLILPSYKEAFGAVANEALLAGCKVIVSRNAGSQCLVREGENGYIIDPYSPESILSAMKKAMEMTKEVNRPIKLKPNAMPFTFESYIGNIIDEMNK